VAPASPNTEAADAGPPERGRELPSGLEQGRGLAGGERADGLPAGVEQGRGRPGAPLEPGSDTPAEAPSVAERGGPRTCAALFEDVSVERTLTRNGWAYGFVKNPCDFTVDKPRVDLAFYDAGGQLVERAHGYAAHDLLLPDERSPVTVLLKPYPERWARHEAQVTAREPFTAYRRRASLEVVDTQADPQRLGSSLVVRVRVRNTDTEPVEHVRVTAGMFDGAGKLRASHLGFIEPSPLAPGQQGEARVYLLPSQQIEPYRLEAWASGVIYTQE
ncbi:MAG TPA: hypothetical protein P5076_17900, partial [Myxococcota bacterium]|nr:hypothetical protein [Myxococcota bacterium]